MMAVAAMMMLLGRGSLCFAALLLPAFLPVAPVGCGHVSLGVVCGREEEH